MDFFKIIGGGVTVPTVTSYATAVLADEPYAYWRFEETTAVAVVADLSGNGYNAVNGTSITDANCVIAGIVSGSGYATEFDGEINDIVILPILTGLHTIFAAGPVTIEGWIKTTTTLTRTVWRLAAADDNPKVLMRAKIPSGASGTVRIEIGSKLFASEDIDFNDGNLHHFVVIVDGSTLTCRLYLDNVERILTPSGAFTESWNSLTTNYLMGTDLTYTIPGVLDEFAIYPRALTEAEIAEHYNLGS